MSKQRFDRIEKILEQHSNKFDQIEKTLEQHSNKFDQIEKTLEQHSNKFDQIEKTLERHSHTLEQHSQRFDQVDEHLVRLDERFDRLEKSTREGFVAVFEFMEEKAIEIKRHFEVVVESMRSDNRALAEKVDDHDGRLTVVEERVGLR